MDGSRRRDARTAGGDHHPPRDIAKDVAIDLGLDLLAIQEARHDHRVGLRELAAPVRMDVQHEDGGRRLIAGEGDRIAITNVHGNSRPAAAGATGATPGEGQGFPHGHPYRMGRTAMSRSK